MESKPILLIEDNEDDAELVRAYIGFSNSADRDRMLWARDLSEALSMGEKARPDVVLLDLGLPDTEGLESVERLCAAFECPIIVLSGERDQEVALKAARIGAHDYLIKEEINERQLARAIAYARERGQILDELKVAKSKAELASKAKSDFLAVMSHEFRTPMNGMLGCLNLIRSRIEDKEIDPLLGTLESCAQGQLALINDILDISQIEAGKTEIEYEVCDLKELLRSTVDTMRLSAQAKGLELELVVSQGVPRTVHTDSRRLRQVLFNLIGNALKFTESGWVKISVCQEETARLRFEVSDTGVGIPEDKLDLVFEEFTQVDSSRNRRFNGVGLGLSICRKLVRLLGGEICVSSVEGEGSVFSFDIRTEKETGVNRSGDPDRAGEEFVGDWFAGENPASILLVEDSSAFRALIEREFKELGYEIDVVGSGSEAVEKAWEKGFDYIFMDLSLPGIDGFVAAAEIMKQHRERGAAPLIVATTIFKTPEMRARCHAAGFFAFLPKPFSKEEIARIIAGHSLFSVSR